MLTLLYYARCDTCRKAKKWLDEHQISYQLRDIKEAPPTAEELARWQEASGLPLKQFFNTSGQLYRSMGLKDKLPAMDETAMRALLATDGMLIKRPLLVGAEWTRVGFRPEQWAETLGVAP